VAQTGLWHGYLFPWFTPTFPGFQKSRQHKQCTTIRIIHPDLNKFVRARQFNLRHTAITFHYLFTVSLWACQISYLSPVPPYSVSVWRTDLMTPDLLPDSLLIGFTFWFHFFLTLVIPHVWWQTKLASSLVVNSLMQANLLVWFDLKVTTSPQKCNTKGANN